MVDSAALSVLLHDDLLEISSVLLYPWFQPAESIGVIEADID